MTPKARWIQAQKTNQLIFNDFLFWHSKCNVFYEYYNRFASFLDEEQMTTGRKSTLGKKRHGQEKNESD